jgi:hypothetical protein
VLARATNLEGVHLELRNHVVEILKMPALPIQRFIPNDGSEADAVASSYLAQVLGPRDFKPSAFEKWAEQILAIWRRAEKENQGHEERLSYFFSSLPKFMNVDQMVKCLEHLQQ